MGVLADLLQSVSTLPAHTATRLVCGRRFTGIGGRAPGDAGPTVAGLAYTGRGEVGAGYDVVARSASLAGDVLEQPLLRLAGQVLPATGGRTDVGAAALNALLGAQLVASDLPLGAENGLDLVVRLSADKSLAMVGHFPYLDDARLRATRLWTLELQPEGDDLPASAAPEVLPQADVVGITGSTLANGTLPGVLALCRPDAVVVMIGPTTPLSPVLFDYGVDVLCGAIVDDPGRTLAVLADGGAKPTPRIPGTRMVSLTRTSA